MVPWSFLSISLNDCAVSIINNEGLIRKIYLPKMVFPLVRVLIALVTFIFSLAALFLLLWPLGAAAVVLAAFSAGCHLALLAAFSLGLGLVAATLNTFYRDCGHLIAVVLQAWYFATPILFPIGQFDPAQQWRLRLNRDVLLHRNVPRHFVFGAMAPDRSALDRGGNRGGDLGNRLCHLQVSGRQDGLSTLSGRCRQRLRLPPADALIELNDVSLRFVNYADKQYSLKRAVLDLVLRRESPAPASEFWCSPESA